MIGRESDRLLGDAAALIRIRTCYPPGDEQVAAEWLGRRLEGIASHLEIQPVSDSRANFIASFEFGPGPSVLFCTHLDVVPPQREEQWEPAVVDGRLYGRGACDAKGTLAAMLAACEQLRGSAESAQGRLVLAAVADEESGATGVQRLLASDSEFDYAVIGEPSESRPVFASRGAVRLSVSFVGRSAHTATLERGLNPVYAAARLALAVEARNAELRDSGSSGSCAATVINGGSKINVVPEVCSIQIDRRLGPDETVDFAVSEVETIVQAILREEPGLSYAMSPAGAWLPPISADPDSPFVRAVLRAVDASEPGPTFIGATDAPYLVRAGIPTVILGAGSVTVAHSDHEYVEIDALKAAVGIYERVARALLVDTGRRFEERTEWDLSAIRGSVGAARDPAEGQPE